MTKSCTLDRIDVRADDVNSVSDAGLLVAATLGQRLGLDELLREHLTVPGSAGANPDRKCLTLIHSLLAGGDCIEDVNALRAGSTGAVLGHRVAASSTIGTFLRAFGFGHARQLDVVARRLLARAVAAGAHRGFKEVGDRRHRLDLVRDLRAGQGRRPRGDAHRAAGLPPTGGGHRWHP